MKYGPSDLIVIIVTIVTFFVFVLDKKRFRNKVFLTLPKTLNFHISNQNSNF